MTVKEMRAKAFGIIKEARNLWDIAEAKEGGPTAEDVKALDVALDSAGDIEERATKLGTLEEFEKRAEEIDFRPVTAGDSSRDSGSGTTPEGERDLSVLPEKVREFARGYAERSPENAKYVRVSCTPEYRAAFRAYVSSRGVTPEQQRALSEGTDSEGGFLVPIDYDFQLLLQPTTEAVMPPLVARGTTNSMTVKRPTVGAMAVTWGSEAGVKPFQDFVAASTEVKIRKLVGITKSSEELEEDSGVDLGQLLATLYADAAAVKIDTAILNGNPLAANPEPTGIRNGAVVTRVNTAAVATIAADDFIELIYSVPRQYANNTKLVMGRVTEKRVRKFKDGDGQYIWGPGIGGGTPPNLLGVDIHWPLGGLDETSATGAEIAVAGDFKQGYLWVERLGTTIQRLDELYAVNDQVGFKFRMRVGGNVATADALRILKVA